MELAAREGSSLEFKEAFNWGSKDKYAKTMAAYANNNGGYIVFGVTNHPRRLVGMAGSGFENLDEATVTAYLNATFAPQILYEKFVLTIQNVKVGCLYTHVSEEKPVMPIKNDGDIKEAEIYYRYNARSEKIKFPELQALLREVITKERKSWMSVFERVAKIGPSNAGIMDVLRGSIEGEHQRLLIDRKLVPKLRFITEGKFEQKGKPVLKLVGDVQPVNVSGGPGNRAALRIIDDPTAPAVREETILENYPLDHKRLVRILSSRYSDFKTNQKFYDIKRKLMKDIKYCRSRYLDPGNPSGVKKDFYSPKIIAEFDKHYMRRKRSESAPAAEQGDSGGVPGLTFAAEN
jgi:hypothetical protein